MCYSAVKGTAAFGLSHPSLVLRFQSLSLSRVLKFLFLLPKSLQLLLLKLFADVTFQGSNVTAAVLGLSVFFSKQFVHPEHFFNTEF